MYFGKALSFGILQFIPYRNSQPKLKVTYLVFFPLLFLLLMKQYYMYNILIFNSIRLNIPNNIRTIRD